MMNNMNFSKLQPKNEVVNLKGKKHEDGGIPLSETKEAEDNESMIGSFMFSNRLMTDKKNTFSDEAKRIEKKYKKDSSILANKSKKKELERLAQSQEQLKQEMAPKENTQEMAYGGSTKKKYGVGGLMAAQAGIGMLSGGINMYRGLTEDAREFDPLEFEKAKWKNADFEKANFKGIDLSGQRTQAQIDTAINRAIGTNTINQNSTSSGQALSANLFNNSRLNSQLSSVNRDSFMNEENTNTQIANQEEQFNVGTANQFSQFNTQSQNQTNMFNTQIGNQELMANFDIKRMNANARDARQQMIFDGFGQMLQQGSNSLGDYSRYKQDKKFMELYPEAYKSMG